MIKKHVDDTAMHIWHILSNRGSLTLRQIGELIHTKDTLIMLAIGWLCKENKVHIEDKNGILYFEANKVLTEIYY